MKIFVVLFLLFCNSYRVKTVQMNYKSDYKSDYKSEQASKHFSMMVKNGKCHSPFKRVVLISDLFPKESNKKYIPHCTVIHFCGQETGCCEENEKCLPEKVQEIVLYFRVIELLSNGTNQLKQNIQAITFQNHTQCHCQPINDNKRFKNNSKPNAIQKSTYSVNYNEDSQRFKALFSKVQMTNFKSVFLSTISTKFLIIMTLIINCFLL